MPTSPRPRSTRMWRASLQGLHRAASPARLICANFGAMRYMLLIVEPPGQRATARVPKVKLPMWRCGPSASACVSAASWSRWSRFALARPGARVQRQNGKTSVVDGPFAEAKEMIGGFHDRRGQPRGSAGHRRRLFRQRSGARSRCARWHLVSTIPSEDCRRRKRAVPFVVAMSGAGAPPRTARSR